MPQSEDCWREQKVGRLPGYQDSDIDKEPRADVTLVGRLSFGPQRRRRGEHPGAQINL